MSVATTEKRKTRPADGDAIANSGESAEHQYRAAIQAAAAGDGPAPEPDRKLLDGALRLLSDWEADLATLRSRRKAAETLAGIPALEAEADRLAAVASDDGGGQLIADFGTVGELWAALESYRRSQIPGYVSPQKRAAHEARKQAQFDRNDATNALLRTADPALDRDAAELRRQIQGIQARIANRAPLVNLEQRIATQTNFVNELAAGSRWSVPGYDPRPTRDIWKDEKQKLRGMMAQRPMVADAQRETEADEKRIAALEGKIADLLASKLIPERMAWST
jgi:hypothetical protein